MDVLAVPEVTQALADHLGADTSWWWKLTPPPDSNFLVAGCRVVQQRSQPQHRSGPSSSSSIACSTPRASAGRPSCAGGARRSPAASRGTSGSTISARPVSTISSMPRPRVVAAEQLDTSTCTRSAVIRSSWPAIEVIASTTLGARLNPSWLTNLTPRSKSAAGRRRRTPAGWPGVQHLGRQRVTPPYGSTNRCSVAPPPSR